MTKIEVPFHDDMREAAIDGRKTCTSRFHRLGQEGDTFWLGAYAFVITGVYRLQLGYVAKYLYREEGFDSEEAFWKKWREIHPRRSDRGLMVYAHFFEEFE